LASILGPFTTSGFSQQPVKRESDTPSLDRQLLDDLDNALLEGLSNDFKETSSTGDSRTLPDEPLDAEPPMPRRMLTPDAGAVGEDIGSRDLSTDDHNPLARLEQKMRQVQDRLARRDPSQETQSIQREIATELASLLESLQQQQQQNQNQGQRSSRQQQSQPQSTPQQSQSSSAAPSSEPSSKPAQDSEERLGKSNDVKLQPEALRDLYQRAWGHLPAQVRDQMQAAAQEQFLPKYQILIEEYYQRLAEENGAR
jgi:TolA-binding protein